MRVKIESTGGFAGREMMVAKYDTDDLPKDQAERIEEAVRTLADADASGEPGEIGADLPSYRVTIGDPDGDPKVFEVCGEPDADVNAPLTRLLQGPVEPEERPEDEAAGGAAGGEESARRNAPPSPSGL
ncbi:protealysin inhibitor emfourin [Actinomadura hibisca]|uniref:protealysin inhibitor emfourin n=1 Tax=Actinomadura hibisca TaxID=68565 RepID=UPI00083116B4|nr:protealysin inhibitor emfourin [Actinomadura hibisca]